MKKYLSIDLDFWKDSTHEVCEEFLTEVHATRLPVTIVDEHQDLLKYINASGCDTVYNLDYHSDIANNYTDHNDPEFKKHGKRVKNRLLPEFNCGTWANWMDKREKFLWLYPHNVAFDMAYCHEPQTDEYSPFLHPELADFNQVEKRMARIIPSWILNGITEVGISCSYDWLHDWDVLPSIVREIFGWVPKRHNDVIHESNKRNRRILRIDSQGRKEIYIKAA